MVRHSPYTSRAEQVKAQREAYKEKKRIYEEMTDEEKKALLVYRREPSYSSKIRNR